MVKTKRQLSVTLKYRDGTTQTLIGDAAQNVLQQYKQRQQGGINKALRFINPDGLEDFKGFHCLCGLVNNGMTETTEEKDDCTSITCIDCSNCTGSDTDLIVVFELDAEGNLYVTYYSDIVTFTLESNGDLYADYDTTKWSFTLDENGNLYYEEVA